MHHYPSISQSVIDSQNDSNGIIFKDYTPRLTPMFEAQNENKIIVDTDDLNQAQIYKSYKFPFSRNINDEAKFELVNTILGGSPNSRLFSDLREKQNLAYSVSSNIQSFENTGILTFKIQTTTDNPQAGIKSYDNVKKSLEGLTDTAHFLQFFVETGMIQVQTSGGQNE
jgi:predicted Zn-dependent peptidase